MISHDKMQNDYSTMKNLIAGANISGRSSHNENTNSLKTTNRTNVAYNELMSHHSQKTVFMLLAVLLYICAAATGDLSGKFQSTENIIRNICHLRLYQFSSKR